MAFKDNPSQELAAVVALAPARAGRGSAPAWWRSLPFSRGWARAWLSTALLLIVWQLGSALEWINPRVLPGPVAVLQAAHELASDGSLWQALWVSLGRVAAGAALGLSVGLVLGVGAGFSRHLEDAVDRPLQMLKTIPFTALIPLFILWFGIGELPKVLLIAVGVLLPVYINTFGGIRNVDNKLVEVARVAKMSHWAIATRILLPAALPTIFLGVRFALGLAWMAVVVAETVGADSGVGFLMASARQFVRTDIMLLCLCIYALLGLLTDHGLRLLERRLLAWRVSYSG